VIVYLFSSGEWAIEGMLEEASDSGFFSLGRMVSDAAKKGLVSGKSS
jgi:hypothetical protein